MSVIQQKEHPRRRSQVRRSQMLRGSRRHRRPRRPVLWTPLVPRWQQWRRQVPHQSKVLGWPPCCGASPFSGPLPHERGHRRLSPPRMWRSPPQIPCSRHRIPCSQTRRSCHWIPPTHHCSSSAHQCTTMAIKTASLWNFVHWLSAICSPYPNVIFAPNTFLTMICISCSQLTWPSSAMCQKRSETGTSQRWHAWSWMM